MANSFRIATWNLERTTSRSWKKAPAQDRRMAEIDADVWVLTETFTDRSPGDGYDGWHSPHHPDRRSDERERWTAVWSRWPITPLDDPPPHRRGTVIVRVEAPIGPIIVYGSVIAWANESSFDDGRPARAWQVHLAEIERQSTEWAAIRRAHPEVPLVVAGDLNQGRSGRRWDYGTSATSSSLTSGLERAGLRCLTEVDLVADGLVERSHVEHICLDPQLEMTGHVLASDRVDDDGTRLSDHPTIAVDVLPHSPRTVRRSPASASR